MRDYSNYHEVDNNKRLFSDGKKIFEYSLTESPDSYTVIVNGEEKNILMQSRANYNERLIEFTEGAIQWGDIIQLDDESWLVSERPYNNKIYDRSIMKLCNSGMSFEEWEREIIDYDDLGNPIYSDGELVITSLPCVVDSVSNYEVTTGEKVNVPEGDVVLLIQNTDSELIELNKTFKMFENDYRIAGIDKSKVYGDNGILVLIAKRTTK